MLDFLLWYKNIVNIFFDIIHDWKFFFSFLDVYLMCKCASQGLALESQAKV